MGALAKDVDWEGLRDVPCSNALPGEWPAGWVGWERDDGSSSSLAASFVWASCTSRLSSHSRARFTLHPTPFQNAGTIIAQHPRGHAGSVLSLALAGASSNVVSAGEDGTVKVWGVPLTHAAGAGAAGAGAAGRERGQTKGKETPKTDPDPPPSLLDLRASFLVKTDIAAAAPTGKPQAGSTPIGIGASSGPWVSSVAVSPDEKVLAAAAGKYILLYSLEDSSSASSSSSSSSTSLSAKHSAAFRCISSQQQVDSLSFTPQGDLVASFYGGVAVFPAQTIRATGGSAAAGTGAVLREAEGGKQGGKAAGARGGEPFQFEYNGWPVTTKISPDGRWAAAGCNDCTVHLWELDEKVGANTHLRC